MSSHRSPANPEMIGVAFLLGLATAAAWVVYIREVNLGNAGMAALADLVILLMGSAGVQLWSRKKSFWLFVAFDVGAALGTYLLVRGGYGH